MNKICIDFHGVLTNGKINISSDGKTQYEAVHVKDVAAIRELIALGYEVYIVTASSSPIIDAYCKKVGCVKIQNRTKKDLFPKDSYLAIGDSVFDYEFLLDARFAFCPADSDKVILDNSEIVTLNNKGGDGCVAELLEFLKEHEGLTNYAIA